MTTQNFKNNARYYAPHHFIFYPLISGLITYCIFAATQQSGATNLWLMILFSFLGLTALAFMTRQHYALILQNRIIRMEMRFRYYILTHRRFEVLEKQLSEKQIYALRFASDEELIALVQRTLAENLSPTDIKKSIKNWVIDDMRV